MGILALIVICGIIAALPRNRNRNRIKPTKQPNNELIDTIQAQIDALCELALLQDKQSRREHNPTKKQRLVVNAANTYARVARLQERIDKLTAS